MNTTAPCLSPRVLHEMCEPSASLRLCVKKNARLSMLALACAGLFAITASAALAGVTATPKVAPLSPAPSAHLTFSSADAFTVTPSAVSWNGGLFYSTDATNWHAFDRDGAAAALDSGSGDYRLYFRGTNNTLITGGNLAYWEINAAPASVDCSGNIETLLDYATVDGGGHPAMIANCFANLFKDCTALGSAPELPATNLINNCYVGMFRNCTGLTNAPVLPATTLTGGCYQEMFRDCTSLVQAPALPAMTLPPSCYKGMFTNCTALATAPELPATTLGATCYQYMFAGCTSLTNAPALQAATLAPGCYHSMFHGCTGLTQLPELPATTLASFCYAFMFKDCTGITLHEGGTGPTWGIPNDAAEVMGWNTNMLAGTGGSFTGDPVIDRTYYYTPSTPPVSTAYLTFSSASAFTVAPQAESWDGELFYSTNTTDWVAFTTAGAAAASDGAGQHKLHLRGTNNEKITGAYAAPGWTFTAAGEVACSGSFEALLDYPTVEVSGHPEMEVYCFGNLFRDCAALVSAPPPTATNLNTGCYAGMFRGCTGLKTAPALPATKMGDSCYANMFRGCTSLTQAPELAAMNLSNYCYQNMFAGCTSLAQAPVLPAETLAGSCYAGMFAGCTALTQAPLLPALTLGSACYDSMFYGCTGLTNAPALPATTLDSRCYAAMFGCCTSLTQAPALPATTLTGNGYECMFTNCTALAQAPALPATNMAYSCYGYMFAGCTSLTNAPALPSMTLADGCYMGMFAGCTGLAQAPVLPATNLGWGCYGEMFAGCTNLTRLPELSATMLPGYCYYGMFSGCTGIALYEDGTGQAWGIPDGATSAWNWNLNMLAGTGGSFTGDPEIGVMYYYTASPPPTPNTCLAFSSAEAFTVAPQEIAWPGQLKYSTDKMTWANFDLGGADAAYDAAAGEYRLYFRGRNNTHIAENSSTLPWKITTGGKVACSGNIEALLDHTVVADGRHPTMDAYCFASFFRNCQALTSAPLLPATNLTHSCYWGMFSGCTALTNAPALPATTLASTCYRGMFWGCTSLAQAPALPATNLANSCYYYMFNGCTSLTSAPALPATTLSEKCYTAMFYDCAGLTAAPALPAMTLGNFCYDNMFRGCTSLTKPPALPATNLVDYCYQNMFEGCTGLTRLPELPAKNLALECYDSMFKNCTGIVLNTTGPGKLWRIPAGAVAATRWNTYMFTGTSGDYTGDPVIGADYYLASAIPDAPLFAADGSALVLSDGTLSIKIINAESGIYYTLYTTTNLIEPNWERCGPSTYATQDGTLIFENIDTTDPRRFFKVKAGFTMPLQ